MGFLDSIKGMFGKGKKPSTEQVQQVAKKADDQAEKLATKEGTVGDVAEKAHEQLDKVDGD